LALDPDYLSDVVSDGDEITINIVNSGSAPVQGGGGGSVILTLNWPAEFSFSGRDAIPMQYNDVSFGTRTLYRGIFSAGLNAFIMEATTYLGPGT